MKKYPDITKLLQEKGKRRRQLARLSFEEKIEIVNKWRSLTKQIRENRVNAPKVTGKRQGRQDA